MNGVDLAEFFKSLSENQSENILIAIITIAVLLACVIIYLFIKILFSGKKPQEEAENLSPPSASKPAPRIVAEPVKAAEPPKPEPVVAPIVEQAEEVLEATRKVEVTLEPAAPVVSKPVAAAASPVPVKSAAPSASAGSHIPQEMVLRRHYISHIRYMLETLSQPRPSECVLRRHYEQLISSKLEDCLADESKLNRLINEFNAHRKSAFA